MVGRLVLTVLTGGLASVLTIHRKSQDTAILYGAWVASGLTLAAFALRVYAWVNIYSVMTDYRLIDVRSTAGVRADEIPLKDISALNLRRSVAGRLLGYGTLVVKSSVPGGETVRIKYLPYPDRLYLEMHGLLFPSREDEE
ncbi:MAG TPA: PH domain-containing protein [Trebonia sp.]|jgi:hypothetical protein